MLEEGKETSGVDVGRVALPESGEALGGYSESEGDMCWGRREGQVKEGSSITSDQDATTIVIPRLFWEVSYACAFRCEDVIHMAVMSYV